MTAFGAGIQIADAGAGSFIEPAPLQIGEPASSFARLLATDGARYGMADFADRDILVLVFSGNRCPTAKAYSERLNELQRDYGTRGVQVVAINSNHPQLFPDESYARMVERATEDAYGFPYLSDGDQRVARAYGPTRTFEIFVLDRERRLRYHGRFDDSRLPERVTTRDLANALDDLLAGNEVRVAVTRPFGCSLDLVELS
jgi:peroxiredoxin